MRNEKAMCKDNAIQHSTFNIRHSARPRAAMTLVELLIVIVVIGILVSSVLVASTSLIGKSKARNTQAVLQIVADAVEQFKRSETEKPTITRNADYKRRYGLFPPDELEVFGTAPVNGVPTKLATPAGSVIVPATFAGDMKFYMDGDCSDPACQSSEHRDLAALIVAIESQGGESAAILDRISDRNRSAGVLGLDGKPLQYLNRPQSINQPPKDGFDSDDLQIRYVLDDWGVPIGYLAQRDHPGHGSSGTSYPSMNMSAKGNWNEAATELIRLNGGQPVIFSYGPDGKNQLKSEIMGADAAASLVGDFAPANATPENKEHIIDHPANADNVYSNDQLRDKLAKGILQ